MVFAHVPAIVLVIFAAAIACSAIFAWLTVGNTIDARATEDPGPRLYATFTAMGTIDAALIVASFLPVAELTKAHMFQLMWVSGPLCFGTWLRAVGHFIGRGSNPTLRRLSWLMFAVAGIYGLDFAWSLVSGDSLLFAFRPRNSASVLVQAAGDVLSHDLGGRLMALVVIGAGLAGSGTLVVLILRACPGERVLLFGVLLTAALAMTQAFLAGGDSRYNMPLLFMANIVEAMRVTWVSRARVDAEIAALRRRQDEQSILITHQLEQLQLAQRMTSLGEHTAQVTHDLRNPLGAIQGALELAELELAESTPDRGKVRESLAIAHEAIDHSLTLV
ncbi:MAG: hypothetical protein KC457_20070, partial [Myxococcales bacterium]|nr:hypothetical protein [Myxococcales bacterium]